MEEVNEGKWVIPALKQMKEICLLYIEVNHYIEVMSMVYYSLLLITLLFIIQPRGFIIAMKSLAILIKIIIFSLEFAQI